MYWGVRWVFSKGIGLRIESKYPSIYFTSRVVTRSLLYVPVNTVGGRSGVCKI